MLGVLVAVTSGAACAAAAQQTVDGADAGNRPAAAPAPTVASPAARHPQESAHAAAETAGDEPPGAAPADPGDRAHDEPRRGPEAPRAVWSPEAVRARHTPGEAGDPPSPEHEYGATTATAPPDAGEVLPGPSVPHGPVPLVSSREGSEPPAELAAAILGAYTAFWESYWEAARQPVNPGHPGIGRHSVEPLRSRTVGVLLGRAAEGVALRLPGDHGAGRVVHIEGWGPDSAEVLDCFVDTAVLYEVSTGRVRNDEQATVVHLALLRREGGTWRVVEIFEQAIHTGRTDGCILQANTRQRPEPPATALASQVGPERGGVAGAPRSRW